MQLTVNPRQLAGHVLHHLSHQIDEADRLRKRIGELLDAGRVGRAAEHLQGYLSTCAHMEETLAATLRLLRVSADAIDIAGEPLADLLDDSAEHRRRVESLIDRRNFEDLADLLQRNASATRASRWRRALIVLPHARPLHLASVPA